MAAQVTPEEELALLRSDHDHLLGLLDVITRTGPYRLLRRLGRWGWLERLIREAGSRSGGRARQGSIDPTLVARIVARNFLWNKDAFAAFEAQGVHITPVHFYSVIPNVSELPEELFTRETPLPGIEMNEAAQVALLDELATRYRNELDGFSRKPTAVAHEYYLENPMFRSVDSEVLYGLIRRHRPRRIVEVGSGYSTYVSAAAARKNAAEGSPVELIAVEPYPNPVLEKGFPGLTELRRQRLQDADPSLFTSLRKNDILFIDSSHVLRIDSDVRKLLLEILPSLAPGVLVHIHDIFLPSEYPRQWVVEERRFWNEQYMLQAFLAFNGAFEVVWGGSFMHIRHREELKRAFSSYDPGSNWPGSFWIRRTG